MLVEHSWQGEYTTGWTGSGASKSDKKVRAFVSIKYAI
jgi:hypothetical protein